MKLIVFMLFILYNLSYSCFADHLILGASENYEEIRELNIEIVTLLYKKINRQIKILNFPIKRSELHLKDGFIDGLIGEQMSLDHEDCAVMATFPLSIVKFGAVARKGILNNNASFTDFLNYRVGIDHHRVFDEKSYQLLTQVTSTHNSLILFKLLNRNKLDIIIDLDLHINNHINDYLNIVKLDFSVELPLFHVLRNEHAYILPELEQAMSNIKKTGELDKIYKNFMIKHKIESGVSIK